MQGLKNLRELSLTGLTDTSIPLVLGFTELNRIVVHESPITDAGVAQLTALKNLTSLELWGSRITNAGLKTLSESKRLNDLNLRLSQITDEGLSHLEKMTGLTRLAVIETKITPTGVAALQAKLPNCKIEWGDSAKATTPASASQTDPDRRAAEWVLSSRTAEACRRIGSK